MTKSVFIPADILLPAEDHDRWAVIACDQFTSQPEYWQAAEEFAGDSPSALRMIVPEAWLGQVDEDEQGELISRRMGEYLSCGVLSELPLSYIYVERSMLDGSVRRGIVGAVDLENYDFAPGSESAVRATEETIIARLPARMAVRERAAIELPHIMLLAREDDDGAFRLLESVRDALPVVYDFDLMLGGGHICGRAVTGELAQAVSEYFIPDRSGAKLIIGDGNHSLAAARSHWLNLKPTLTEEEAAVHPARYCLAEVCGLWDEAIAFHPIHRIVFSCDPRVLAEGIQTRLGGGDGIALELIYGDNRCSVSTAFTDSGSVTAAVQQLLDEYAADNGAEIDYIHGEDETAELAHQPGSLGIIMPNLDRSELFAAADGGRIFPRKCFSIGSAREKRYYLEARGII